MNQTNSLRRLLRAGIFVAMGVLLPLAFHVAGILGTVFLPMHIPVLLAGLFLGPLLGGGVGALTPICSSLLTGMPPVMPSLPVMTVELATYGLVCGWLRPKAGLWLSLFTALILGRLAAGGMIWLLAQWVQLPWAPWTYMSLSLIKGLPGISLQVVFIPLLVKRLEGWNHHEAHIQG